MSTWRLVKECPLVVINLGYIYLGAIINKQISRHEGAGYWKKPTGASNSEWIHHGTAKHRHATQQ